MECSMECAKIKKNPTTDKTCSVFSYDPNLKECKSLTLKFYEKSNYSYIKAWADTSAILYSELNKYFPLFEINY